jgi:DNA-binding NarL/FixJ family response regulator
VWSRACGKSAAARTHLDAAVTTFARLGMPVEAARTRLSIAELMRGQSPEAAATEARNALDLLDRVGATPEADAAAALLRDLGTRVTRVRPRSQRTLTNREREVLALLGEGLSNPEIADRLFISRRTAEEHVANVLSKLGLRSRAEAVAAAVRGLGGD